MNRPLKLKIFVPFPADKVDEAIVETETAEYFVNPVVVEFAVVVNPVVVEFAVVDRLVIRYVASFG